jgi:tetratricopeptide (TPR) repeat protein
MEILEEGTGELVGWRDPDENREWVRANKVRGLKDKRMTVADAVGRFVRDGDFIAVGGFGHVRVPITELGRLVALRQANQRMDRGDEFWSKGNIEAALRQYEAGSSMSPQIPGFRFWYAVALADAGRLDEALPIFRKVFDREPNFALLARRLPISGRLRGGPKMMAQIFGEID